MCTSVGDRQIGMHMILAQKPKMFLFSFLLLWIVKSQTKHNYILFAWSSSSRVRRHRFRCRRRRRLLRLCLISRIDYEIYIVNTTFSCRTFASFVVVSFFIYLILFYYSVDRSEWVRAPTDWLPHKICNILIGCHSSVICVCALT